MSKRLTAAVNAAHRASMSAASAHPRAKRHGGRRGRRGSRNPVSEGYEDLGSCGAVLAYKRHAAAGHHVPAAYTLGRKKGGAKRGKKKPVVKWSDMPAKKPGTRKPKAAKKSTAKRKPVVKWSDMPRKAPAARKPKAKKGAAKRGTKNARRPRRHGRAHRSR